MPLSLCLHLEAEVLKCVINMVCESYVKIYFLRKQNSYHLLLIMQNVL